MRPFLALFICSAFLFSCSRVDIAHFNAYPDLKTIAEKVDKDYRIRQDAKLYYTLAKKPKGWVVLKMSKTTFKPISESICWSSETREYVRIPADFFRTADLTGENDEVSARVRFMDYSYDHSVYFGYDGWADDAIDALDDGGLNDTLTEALARAYGEKCMELTRPGNAGYVRHTATIADDQVKEFCKWGDKDIETYKALLEMNPGYETLVGKVKTKMSNEYLFLWSELYEKGKGEEAKKYLVDGLYDDLMLNFATNTLKSAEQDAILFCNGDNDTYPLWYAQQKLGVRKDVAVMNLSLMNIPEWLYLWQKDWDVALSLSKKLYDDSLTDQLYLNKYTTNTSTFGMNTLKEGLETKDPTFLQKSAADGSGNNYFLVPFNSVRLSYKQDDTLAPVLKLDSYYILKSDLALMDIIASNYGKRPIYFAQTAATGTLPEGLTPYLSQEGLLVKVDASNPLFIGLDPTHYNLPRFTENMLKNYDYGLENAKSLQVSQIAFNYVISFHSLSTKLMENGDTAKSAEASLACVKNIPLSLIADPAASYLIGEDLLKAGKQAEGKKLLSMSLDKIKDAYEKEKEKREVERYAAILNMIIEDGGKYNCKELISPATQLQENIDKRLKLLNYEH